MTRPDVPPVEPRAPHVHAPGRACPVFACAHVATFPAVGPVSGSPVRVRLPDLATAHGGRFGPWRNGRADLAGDSPRVFVVYRPAPGEPLAVRTVERGDVLPDPRDVSPLACPVGDHADGRCAGDRPRDLALDGTAEPPPLRWGDRD